MIWKGVVEARATFRAFTPLFFLTLPPAFHPCDWTPPPWVTALQIAEESHIHTPTNTNYLPIDSNCARPVGSGKTALMLELCRRLSKDFSLACVTNDIFTTEDTDFLVRNKALEDPERIVAIETGGCPHAAIREDISANLAALEQLQAKFQPELLLIESGGDNLAANYSRELADYIIYGKRRIGMLLFF